MRDEQYKDLEERFNKILEEMDAFDNLVEDYCEDRQKYLDFNNMLFGILGEMGSLADFLDLNVEL